MNADGSPERGAKGPDVDDNGKATGDNVVDVARARFKVADSHYSTQRQQAIADTKFAWGDADNGWQWPENIAAQRGAKVRLTVNATAQHCNQIINNIRQSNPTVKISPADDHADKRTAELVAGLVRNVQVASDADTAHDLAAEHAIYGGEGYWRIDTDYESPTSFDQRITVEAIPNPNMVYIDPGAIKPDRSDAKWCFVFEDLDDDQFKARFGDVDRSSWIEEPSDTWVGKNRVRIADYWYAKEIDDELWFDADTGQAVLRSKAEAGGMPVRRPSNPRFIRKTHRVEWFRCHLIGGADKPHKEQRWPGNFMPVITVIGKEINIDGKVHRKGQVRDLKDPGRILNYAYSEAVETLAIQNKAPYMAAVEAIEGYEPIWKAANLETPVYLPFRAYGPEGQALPRPTKERPPEMAMAMVQLLQLSTEQMRAASGQQNANFGIRSEAQSGIGIQRLKVQGDTATFHFPDNLRRALRYEAIVIVDLIQALYDTRRVVKVLGLDGKEEIATLDPTMQAPYQEQPRAAGTANGAAPGRAPPVDAKEQQAIERIFNPKLGRYDIVIDTGPSYQTQRQEAFDAMVNGAGKDPRFMSIAGDILWKAADFPMADQVAERYERALPPEMREENDPVAHLQQQLQQMQQGLQEAVQRGQQAEAEALELRRKLDGRVIENETKLRIERGQQAIDGFKAETDRLKAIGAGLDPQQVAAMAAQIVMQTMQGPGLEGIPPLDTELEPMLDPNTPPEGPQGPLPGPGAMDVGPGVPADPNAMPDGGQMPPAGSPSQDANPTGGLPGLGPQGLNPQGEM